ncbi:guanine deaminase [Malassezia yamatoensis]|uniref:Guanine deaminase n=1 Tax=Malassezia yamatoensis TaxID=253288 RepID=A0AAJ5Z2K6_9BASI|nr:guanine deaminase [Malassezia yamatoensis]
MSRRLFIGGLVTSHSLSELQIIQRAALGVDEQGVIQLVTDLDQLHTDLDAYLKDVGWYKEVDVIHLRPGMFLCPGFVDTHTANTGHGMHLQLLDWLEQLTFPEEAKFSDAQYAEQLYASVIDRYLRSGTTTACIYATIHLQATKILANLCHEKGLRAFVGRCQMDRNAPRNYVESSADVSCKHTEEFIQYCQTLPNSLVQPILTPRFAIACTPDLLAGIGELATKNSEIRIQTHLDENQSEISETLKLFPSRSSYADVYDHYGLLNQRTILAHAIHLTEDEINLLVERQCALSHCPTSNIQLTSGVFRLMELVRRGLKIGLGSDISGGYSIGLLPVLREANTLSRTLAMQDPRQETASLEILFYIATLGGAQVCGLDDHVGKFAKGYDFDALLVDPFLTQPGRSTPGNPGLFVQKDEPLASVLEKWLFCGDDRNIVEVYVRGRKVCC